MTEFRTFSHSTHTAYELRPWSNKKVCIVIIRETGNKKNLKSLLMFWKFRISFPNKSQWFAMIRTPLFLFEKDNCGFRFGFPNHYLWIIT